MKFIRYFIYEWFNYPHYKSYIKHMKKEIQKNSENMKEVTGQEESNHTKTDLTLPLEMQSAECKMKCKMQNKKGAWINERNKYY